MGPQRILQAVSVVTGIVAVVTTGLTFPSPALAADPPAASAPSTPGERIAVVDLTAIDPAAPLITVARDPVDKKLFAAIAAAGFEPITGDGVEDALAGRDVDRDAFELTAALATAQHAFGELRCNEAVPAAKQAIGLAAARQAAGLAVPELARAWTYVLLCADRDNHVDAAMIAASRLRTLGGSSDVPASVWNKYPAVDTAADLELVQLTIEVGDAAVPGAAIWIDFQRAGVSPLHIALPAGDHVIAAALGPRRGWSAGTAIRSQPTVRVPLADPSGAWSDLAHRVADWHHQVPAPTELAWLLARVHARVAILRTGDTIAAWGQIGRSELPHLLGPTAAVTGTVTDLDRVLGAIADRIHAWNDHAPDPTQPLLREGDAPERFGRRSADDTDKPTKWWVYAAIGGALAVAGGILLVQSIGGNRQRVELTYPGSPP
jgi:hypothetical protein